MTNYFKNENAMLNRQVSWEESDCVLELTDNRVLSSHAAWNRKKIITWRLLVSLHADLIALKFPPRNSYSWKTVVQLDSQFVHNFKEEEFSEKVHRCFSTHFWILDVKAVLPTTHCHSVDALVISICSEITLNTYIYLSGFTFAKTRNRSCSKWMNSRKTHFQRSQYKYSIEAYDACSVYIYMCVRRSGVVCWGHCADCGSTRTSGHVFFVFL